MFLEKTQSSYAYFEKFKLDFQGSTISELLLKKGSCQSVIYNQGLCVQERIIKKQNYVIADYHRLLAYTGLFWSM